MRAFWIKERLFLTAVQLVSRRLRAAAIKGRQFGNSRSLVPCPRTLNRHFESPKETRHICHAFHSYERLALVDPFTDTLL